MINLQDLFDTTAGKNNLTYYKRNKESCDKIGAANRGLRRSAETRALLSALALSEKRGKPVMTPIGLFPSRIAAAEALSIQAQRLDRWIKKFPEKFYYVEKKV